MRGGTCGWPTPGTAAAWRPEFQWQAKLRLESGWTAQVVALVRGRDLWVANAGDSRCVASRRGRALALTHDHKPTDSIEAQRIAKVCSMSLESWMLHLSLSLQARPTCGIQCCRNLLLPVLELGHANWFATAIGNIRSR